MTCDSSPPPSRTTRTNRARNRWLWLACLPALVACHQGDGTPGPQPVDPVFPYPLDDSLRVHHLQAKSTHNSYHIEPDGNELLDWAYSHAPLGGQLATQGVRHFELDIRYDAAAERFVVFHLKIIDEETQCETLTTCLADIKAWSDGHRAHHPIVVQLEIKDSYPGDAQAEGYFGRLHDEIRSVWPAERIVTPAMVRGDHASVGQAVAAVGWPTLGDCRGRVLFTMDNGGELVRAYSNDHSGLANRLIFPASDPGDAYAAVAVLNDPNDSRIAAAVAANMLVRTRADSSGIEAVNGDTTRLTTALASGAHFISTDFPVPVPEHDYAVSIPEGTPARCNPGTAAG